MLRNLPFEKQQKRYDRDEYRGDISHGSPCQNDNGARNSAGGCGRYALDERSQLLIACKFLVERPGNHYHQIDGKKNTQRGSDGPLQPRTM